MTHDKAGARAQEERLRAVRADLLVRLRPVCSAMPNDIFLEMVESMTAIQVKYELRSGEEPK